MRPMPFPSMASEMRRSSVILPRLQVPRGGHEFNGPNPWGHIRPAVTSVMKSEKFVQCTRLSYARILGADAQYGVAKVWKLAMPVTRAHILTSHWPSCPWSLVIEADRHWTEDEGPADNRSSFVGVRAKPAKRRNSLARWRNQEEYAKAQ